MPLEGELSPSRMGHHRRMRLHGGCVALHILLHPTHLPLLATGKLSLAESLPRAKPGADSHPKWGESPPAQPTLVMARDRSLSADNRTPVQLRLLWIPQPSPCSQCWCCRCPPLKDLGAQQWVPGEPAMLAGPQVVWNNWFF